LVSRLGGKRKNFLARPLPEESLYRWSKEQRNRIILKRNNSFLSLSVCLPKSTEENGMGTAAVLSPLGWPVSRSTEVKFFPKGKKE
jgi:hypothetical protein